MSLIPENLSPTVRINQHEGTYIGRRVQLDTRWCVLQTTRRWLPLKSKRSMHAIQRGHPIYLFSPTAF